MASPIKERVSTPNVGEVVEQPELLYTTNNIVKWYN